MRYALPSLMILAGIIAISGLILAKKPNAKELLDKIVPYQAFIGLGLLGLGIYNVISIGGIFDVMSVMPVTAIAALGLIFTAIVLGFMFAMPQIAKWMPGEGAAEQKGMELAKKLAGFQVLLGVIGLSCALWFYVFAVILKKAI